MPASKVRSSAWCIGLLLVLLPLLGGCARVLARQFIAPPVNKPTGAEYDKTLARLATRVERLQRGNGAEIAFVVLEPGDFRLDYRFFSLGDSWSWGLRFHAPIGPPPAARGTVLLLHGWAMDHRLLLHWGMFMAARDYRVVAVDLRNHGHSGRAPAGYGAREAADIVALLDALRAQRRLVAPLHVFGVSYGAVTALHLAAYAPEVDAVVAMEPFGNAAEAIRSAYAGSLQAGFLPRRQRVLQQTARVVFNQRHLEAAIAHASEQLQLDLRAIDTAPVLASLRNCVLLVHGRKDTIIPHHSSEQLAAVNPHAQLLSLPDDGHFSTPGRLDWLGTPLLEWLDAVERAPTCPPFVLPPPPPVQGQDALDAYREEVKRDERSGQ